jgi:hypothetical protein
VSPWTMLKARRLLVGGRVTALCVEGELRFRVVGDHGVYQVILGRRGPECSCPLGAAAARMRLPSSSSAEGRRLEH